MMNIFSNSLDSVNNLLASDFDPILEILSEDGPINISPDSVTLLLNSAFSDKNPNP